MKVLNLLFQSSTILGLKPKPISWRCVKFPVNLSINRNRGTVWHFRYQVGRLQHVLVLEDPLFTEKRVLAFEDPLLITKHACIENLKLIEKTCSRIKKKFYSQRLFILIQSSSKI